MLIQQILKTKALKGVVTIKPDATVSEAAGRLTEHRIGSIVVSEDGSSVLGILSERDIVRELAKSGGGCLTYPVRDYMTTQVQTCTIQSKAQELMARMTQGRFRHMPVVDGDKMIGIVSIGDVVKAQLSELSMEKEALTSMIMGH
ncbi:CBS domain-containing protein [Pontibaca salina]|uniref:CBS domain-containing protein n=1 Tax=Pontibaca salina TaxID=2795731 RepID=A0A934HSV1_9RHOB|nr:CBS domain-containing protein [Pontibaca salina]MBI6628989.1 CBS domain-containing protein [Pontibaca salina]